MLDNRLFVVSSRKAVGTTGAQTVLRRHVATLLCLTLVCGAAFREAAPASAAQPGQGSSDQQARDEAVRAIPFDQMNAQVKEKLWSVVSRPTTFRRLPTQVIDCDPDLYVFLVRYPEVVVNMWQLMGVTKVQVKRTGAYTFDAADGAGTTSAAELVYGRPDLHVFYALGVYEGPLLHRRIDGNCVLLLRTAYTKREERIFVTSTLDVFVRLNDPGAEIVAKTLQPVVGKAVDGNFVESSRFLGQVSQATEVNGPGMQLLAGRLANLDPPVRQAFVQQVESVYQKAVLRSHQRSSSRPPDPPSRVAPASINQDMTAASTPSEKGLETVPPGSPSPNYRR
jgi:hypothetical protein